MDRVIDIERELVEVYKNMGMKGNYTFSISTACSTKERTTYMLVYQHVACLEHYMFYEIED